MIPIPKEELDLMDIYRNIAVRSYADDNSNFIDHDNQRSMEYVLRIWSENKKEYLYDMFGRKLILKMPFETMLPLHKRTKEFRNVRWRSFKLDKFLSYIEGSINSFLRHNTDWDYSKINDIAFRICCAESIVKNVYEGNSFELKNPINNKTIKVNSGMKILKIIRKFMEFFDIKDEYNIEAFEELRNSQSLINNQSKLRGNLCLSIHPLDFMTMSDNDCDWDSCMHWLEGGGEYCQGTIEMMNSPCVVVAYLESTNKPFEIKNECFSWSNKKWRTLFVVTPDCITSVKNYPYQSEELTMACLNWLVQLAHDNLEREYPLGLCHLYLNCINNAETGEVLAEHGARFSTSIMYKDFYTIDYHLAYCATTDIKICYSGSSECIWCGEEVTSIKSFANSHNRVACTRCCSYNGLCCENCGEPLDEDDAYYFYDGCGPYCRECFDSLGANCAITGDALYWHELTSVLIIKNHSGDIAEDEQFEEYLKEVFCDKTLDFADLREDGYKPYITTNGQIILYIEDKRFYNHLLWQSAFCTPERKESIYNILKEKTYSEIN